MNAQREGGGEPPLTQGGKERRGGPSYGEVEGIHFNAFSFHSKKEKQSKTTFFFFLKTILQQIKNKTKTVSRFFF